MSNRTLRRAAERQARKSEKKLSQQTAQAANIPTFDETGGGGPLSPELVQFAEHHFPRSVEEEARFQSRHRIQPSEAPIAANPNHATGPRTQMGKEISSRNALKHGSCSTATLILNNESLHDFIALEKRWFQGYAVNPKDPATEYEAELVRTAARADWFFQRADRNYAEAEAQLLTAVPDLLKWDDGHHRTLARFLRYRTTHTNTLARHRKAIEDYRKNRAAEAARIQTAKHKEEKLVMAKTRLKLFEQKRQPEDTFLDDCGKEHLAGMLPQATALGFTPKIHDTAGK